MSAKKYLLSEFPFDSQTLPYFLALIIQQALSTSLGKPVQSTSSTSSVAPHSACRGRCYICVRLTHGKGHKKRKDKVRRQQQRCAKCSRHVCNEHCFRETVCADCRGDQAELSGDVWLRVALSCKNATFFYRHAWFYRSSLIYAYIVDSMFDYLVIM